MMNVHTIQRFPYGCIFVRLATALLVSAAVFVFPERGSGREIGASLNGKTFHMALNRPETSPYTAWCVLIHLQYI